MRNAKCVSKRFASNESQWIASPNPGNSVLCILLKRKFYVPQNCSIMKCKHDLKGRVHNFLIKVFSIRVSKGDWRLPEKMLSIFKKKKERKKLNSYSVSGWNCNEVVNRWAGVRCKKTKKTNWMSWLHSSMWLGINAVHYYTVSVWV